MDRGTGGREYLAQDSDHSAAAFNLLQGREVAGHAWIQANQLPVGSSNLPALLAEVLHPQNAIILGVRHKSSQRLPKIFAG